MSKKGDRYAAVAQAITLFGDVLDSLRASVERNTASVTDLHFKLVGNSVSNHPPTLEEILSGPTDRVEIHYPRPLQEGIGFADEPIGKYDGLDDESKAVEEAHDRSLSTATAVVERMAKACFESYEPPAGRPAPVWDSADEYARKWWTEKCWTAYNAEHGLDQ